MLKNELGYTNLITLVLEGSTPRFGEALYNMLRQMTSIFGNDWWDFMVVGVSKWSYDQDEIDDRNEVCTSYPDRCQDEAWFIKEFNSQFQEKFGLTKNFTFAFVDSWSQTNMNIDDEVQQQYWRQETEKLWRAATTNNKTFVFMTIDDVLEENAACKEENLRLHDIIDEEIANLKEDVQQNADTISSMAVTVTGNTKNISANSQEISRVSISLTENINEVSSSLTERVNENQEEIDHNGEIITSLASNVSANTKNINANSVEISLVSTTLTDEISTMSTTLTEKINEVSSSLTQRIDKNEEDIIHNGDTISALASSVAINSNNIDNNSDEISLVSTTLTESINGVSQQVDGNKAAIDEMEVESK